MNSMIANSFARIVSVSVMLPLLWVLSPLSVHAQTLTIGIGGAYQLHAESTTKSDQNIPVQFQNNTEYPSIAKFYDNDLPLLFSAGIELPGQKVTFFFEGTYERSTLHNSFKASENILGSTLDLTSMYYSIGLRHPLNANGNVQVYGSIGIAEKVYRGTSTVSGAEFRYSYHEAKPFRAGAGLVFDRMFGVPFSLVIGGTMESGSVERGEIGVYENNVFVARLLPAGDTSLRDGIFAFRLSLRYSIDLGLITQ